MLAYKYRFHTRASVRYVYKQGRAGRTRSLAIKLVNNNRRTESRCAVVVAKKVAKAAPKRNRMRRRVYEIVRHYWSNIRPGQDMIISIYDARVIDMSADQLRMQILELLQSVDAFVNAPEREPQQGS